MSYKYTILNGNSSVCVGIGWPYKCLLATFFAIGLFAGIYFLVNGYSKDKLRGKNQKLLLVSLDGFRYDLRNKTDTPHLDWFVANGVSVGSVLPVFPTVTLPNHQSIATGLYPENHGILANNMFDKDTKKSFKMRTTSAEFWKDGTPIWIENELQGHRSGNCFWPGYDVLFNGKQATYLPSSNYSTPLLYHDSKNMPWDERVELVIKWLNQEDVNFATLYINDPDEVEHEVGPDPVDEAGKEKLNGVIKRIDATIGKIMKRLKEEKLDSQVNVMIIGDHGQMNSDRVNKVVELTKYVNLMEEADSFGGVCFIYAKPKQTKSIYKKLKKAQQVEGHFKVYLKKDIPDDYHIRNHRLTGDIMYVADPGWTLWMNGTLNRSKLVGMHGFSNKAKDMHPAFFAAGPAFRKNYKKELIHSIDVYALMCNILQIKPRTNDGNFDRIKSVLKEGPPTTFPTTTDQFRHGRNWSEQVRISQNNSIFQNF